MCDRRVFICFPTSNLLDQIRTLGDDYLRALEDEVVVLSESVDYERDIEGWAPEIGRTAKRVFIENLAGSVFSDIQELAYVLGPGTPLEVFDRWFVLRRVDFLELAPRDWQQVT